MTITSSRSTGASMSVSSMFGAAVAMSVLLGRVSGYDRTNATLPPHRRDSPTLLRPGMVISDHADDLHEPVLEGERARSGPRLHVELPEYVLKVSGYGVLADHELRRDLLVALAGGDLSQDVELAGREPMRRGHRASEQRVDRGDVRHGSQLLERLPCSLELEREAVLVSESPTGPAEEHPRARGLVRCFELLPRLKGVAENRQRARGVSGRELHRPTYIGERRAEQVAVATVRDLRELPTGRVRSVEIAGSEHDLRVSGQDSGPPRFRARRAHDSADRRSSGVRVSAREPEQCEAGLRLET